MDHIAAAPVSLGKAAHDGMHRTEYEYQAGDACVAQCKAGSHLKKRVLMVIDVMDGYDAAFVASLPHDQRGSLGYITARHEVTASYELQSHALIERFAPGHTSITYNKGWNVGIDGDAFARVTDRVAAEIRSGSYDLIVFTYDYLERSNGEEKGDFPLDSTPWSDPKKPVACISYEQYLTIQAGGLGADISRNLRSTLPEVTNGRGEWGTVHGTRTLYVSKQVDDVFNEEREISARTRGEAWLDSVDVDRYGLPQPDAHTLREKLTNAGCGPHDAVLCFTGVLTNRCVASSLLHAVAFGFETQLLQGGCCAADAAQHRQGLEKIRAQGKGAVEVVE